MVHSALPRVKVGCHEVLWLHTTSFLFMPGKARHVFFSALQKLFARNRRPCSFHSFGGKPRKACVSGCAATTLTGLTAVGHALKGRLCACSVSCVVDHIPYLLRLVSVSPVSPAKAFTSAVSGFSPYNGTRLGTYTLPTDS